MMSQSFLSIKEVAEQLGVEYKTVYRLIRKGRLPAAKIGNVYRLRPSDVDAYVEQQIELTRQEALREQAEAAAQPLSIRCDRCLRLVKDENGIGGVCEEAGCEAIVCTVCWDDEGARFCRHHEPTPAEKLAAARAARAAGEIPVLVTAVEARRRELNFRDRFDRKLRALSELSDPAGGEPIRVGDWAKLHTAADEAVQLAGLLGGERPDRSRVARLPINVRSRYVIPGGRGRSGLVLEARSFSHLSLYAQAGFDTAPATAGELMDLLLACVSEAEAADVVIVAGLGSTTGWEAEAVALVRGDARGEAWAHRLVFPCLVDLESRATYTAPDHPLLETYVPLFALPLPEEEVAAVERYVRQTITQQSSLTEEEIREATGVSSGAVITAFQRLVAAGGYLIEEVEGVGRVIARL